VPVAGARVTDDFADHVARGSKGTDYAAPAGSPIHPVADGAVLRHGFQPDGGGNYIVVDHGNGLISKYMHLAGITANDGDKVTQGMVLGTVGKTGDATGYHVHVQIQHNGVDVDPQSLIGKGQSGAAQVVGDVNAPRQWDEAAILAGGRDAKDWSDARHDEFEKYAKERFETDKKALNDGFSKAADDVQQWVSNYALNHGNSYPNPNMIPAAMIAKMRPGDAAAYKLSVAKGIETEAKADGRDVGSRAYADMQIMRYTDPAGFASLNIQPGAMTAGQWNQARVLQAETKAALAKPQPWDPYKGAATAIDTFSKFHQDILPQPSLIDRVTKDSYYTRKAAMLESTRMQAEQFAKDKGRSPTTSEWQDFAQNAAGAVLTTTHNWFGPDTTSQIPTMKMGINDVPDADRKRLTAKAQRNGISPSDEQIVDAYIATRDLHH